MTRTSKRIIGSVVSVLIAASTVQAATATERTTRHRAATTTNDQVRNANAYAAPFYVEQDDVARLRNGAESAPAGH